MTTTSTQSFVYLPEVVLDKVFSFLTYDELSKSRLVCKKFDEISSRLLSRGFMRLEKRHAAIYKQMKSVLPRRESERRSHPLYRHCDILQAVETRISMLSMTYMKYIENNLLCFIPGKVLDEIESVLSLVERSKSPPRTHQLLQELRDLSSMAMEHFDEHILPRVKEQMERKTALLAYNNQTSSKFIVPQLVVLDELHKIKKHSKVQKRSITMVSQTTQKLLLKVRKQAIRIRSQSYLIQQQERKLHEQSAKIQEQETSIAEIKKHMDEWDQKYKDLTAELIRARDDILSKASKMSKAPVPTSTAQSKYYVPNIKPRVAQIKTYSSVSVDLERKRKSSFSSEIIPNKLFVYEPPKDEEVSQSSQTFNAKEPYKEIIQEKGEESITSTDILLGKVNLNTPLVSKIQALFPNLKGRKRKMLEDIDLK